MFFLIIFIIVACVVFGNRASSIDKRPKKSSNNKNSLSKPNQNIPPPLTNIPTPIKEQPSEISIFIEKLINIYDQEIQVDLINKTKGKFSYQDLMDHITSKALDDSPEQKINLFCLLIDLDNKLKETKNTLETVIPSTSTSSSANDNSTYVSTTKLGQIFGVKAKPELFKFLIDEGYLIYEGKKYNLTLSGMEYGKYITHNENNSYSVAWDIEKIFPIIQGLIESKLSKFESLFHLTHLDNLSGILSEGLHCHSRIRSYVDVSNNIVNCRRQRVEKCHGKTIHDYVPFYFNIRNAMLYSVQKKIGDKVVILEFSTKVACLPYTIFSDRNAAASNANFTFVKDEVNHFDWEKIRMNSWITNVGSDQSPKQLMMAECLVYDTVPALFITTIHCQNNAIYGEILNMTSKNFQAIKVTVSPNLFF